MNRACWPTRWRRGVACGERCPAGAIGAGDIGRHFPDTAAEFKGIDSRILLRDVFARVQLAGYAIGNLDVTIIAQAPKMAPISTPCAVLAADLQCDLNRVNVKATTTEQLGFTGARKGSPPKPSSCW
jgi:2-C-methyl-D-erythritol 2,4-cyclodiphosphate synthase